MYLEYTIYRNYEGPVSTSVLPTTVSPTSKLTEREPRDESLYPSWCHDNGAPVSEDDIETIFWQLASKFGFQHDSVVNMFEYLMVLLDSRASRAPCSMALESLHSDYIGGANSNYRKWYFCVFSDLSDDDWTRRMGLLSDRERIAQVALYLLVWGEANNVRFMPEALCFVYKTALDWETEGSSSVAFLDLAITPLYSFIRDQQYVLVNGTYVSRNRDHAQVVGYDDVNQFFWSPDNIAALELHDGRKLSDIEPAGRFPHLGSIQWHFSKTYREHRTWLHVLTNFSRIWIIHVCMFWYYTVFNSSYLYTKDYSQLLNNKPPVHMKMTCMALAASLACALAMGATVCEGLFVAQRRWFLVRRFLGLLLLFAANTSCLVVIFWLYGRAVVARTATTVSAIQLAFSFVVFVYLAVTPPAKLFGRCKTHPFTAAFPGLSSVQQRYSALLWVCVFCAKFFELYFFLILSLKDPLRELYTMDFTRCHRDVLLGDMVCRYQGKFLLVLMLVTNFVLFLLDTYLWYVVCNCLFSVILSFTSGISVFSPWRNIFSRLPERIYTKIIHPRGAKSDYAVAQVWNTIVLLLYRLHLLSIDQVTRLIYKFDGVSRDVIQAPHFFVFQDDNNTMHMSDFFTPNKDAERRILFFAQLLSSPIPEVMPIDAVPSFCVLVPHYSEKIILSLREIIKETPAAKMSLLEYLKRLHPEEWDCFVKDTKIHALLSEQDDDSHLHEDLPYYCLGFKNAQPEYTMRTRIWASLRGQTLYRTVVGFMNYTKALKLLYKLETDEPEEMGDMEDDLAAFARRKFSMVIAMQRYLAMDAEERENVLQLCKVYPELKLLVLEEEDGTYYSVLLEYDDDQLVTKYRIKLSGNPIIGDGKSDNQNHSIVFSRGEYIQVIDANQDNYIEECLKIKAVLAEFNEMSLADKTYGEKPGSPVAIVGAREHIISENIGVLGDIAAGKEQTFGTLFARTLAQIGGRLHYGHPDFINAIFMLTRGGISKAQRGLHINEDIYAGMNATSRGGVIKHCDFYQCGKGRDMGFSTILNFTAKIGAGMGEQMLSREHYYMGTTLPIDRFLSFYYAHAGFHINNLLIVLSVQLFMLVLVGLGLVKHEVILCEYDRRMPVTDLRTPLGCYHLAPVLQWVARFVLLVFICFFISFVPLIVQELVEKGVLKALTRIVSHFTLMAPCFEVFTCQIYARLLIDNITLGGAKYVATGRGFATARQPFTKLYSQYASLSIYHGVKVFFSLVFATLAMWQPLVLWFWITCVLMCLAPFLFNPHQFSFLEFLLDYRDFLRWMTRGNVLTKEDRTANSWVGYVKSLRVRYVGTKGRGRAMPWAKRLLSTITVGLRTCCLLVLYVFLNSQTGVGAPHDVNPIVRIVLVAAMPVAANLAVAVFFLVVCVVLSPVVVLVVPWFPTVVAAVAHALGLLVQLVQFEVILALHQFDGIRSLCAVVVVLSIHELAYLLLLMVLSRELSRCDPFWDGRWHHLGWYMLTQPLREVLVKTAELTMFAQDALLCQVLFMVMAPVVLVPYIDKLHTTMLFWLPPSGQSRGKILSKRARRRQAHQLFRYALVFVVALALVVGLLVVPLFLGKYVPLDWVPLQLLPLIQPTGQNHNDTGEFAPPSVARQAPPPRVLITM